MLRSPRAPRLLRFAGLLLALSASACDGCGDDKSRVACEPGRAGCECAPDGTCENGLTCEANLCAAEETLEIIVEDPNARACEVLLLERGGKLSGVDFAEAVRGTHLRQAPRIALSFTRRSNESFGSGDIQVRYVGDSANGLGLSQAECFDRAGRPIASATVKLGD